MTRHAPRPDRSSLAELRAYVAAAVDASSARVIARQVGMSSAGLLKFLRGNAPTPPAYRKLRLWYEPRRAAEAERAKEAARAAPRGEEVAPTAEAERWEGPPRVVLRLPAADEADRG